MIPGYIKSTIENIHGRIKNPFSERNATPFAGAFLIALIIYNWQLLFSLFNFDNLNTRIQKLEIISAYLNEINWAERLGWPLAIAFGSIFFYYIFSYISLGITTFFNRWFKATILYYTDRSKIITREELEQTMNKMNVLRLKHEELRKTFAESQSELEDFKDQIQTKASELMESKLDLEKKTKALTDLEQQQKGFKVLYARYGKGDNYSNLTDGIRELLTKNNSFKVENNELGGDPIKNTVKELFVVYQISQNVKTFTANESEIVELKDNTLVSLETKKSKMKQKMNNNK